MRPDVIAFVPAGAPLSSDIIFAGDFACPQADVAEDSGMAAAGNMQLQGPSDLSWVVD